MSIALTLVFVLIFSGLAIAQDTPIPSPASPLHVVPPASAVYRVGGDVKPPRVIEAPDPKLTLEEQKQARKAKYKGAAMLMIVVGEDGSVRDAQVTRSVGAFLDSKAVELVKNWKFEPANKRGKPVAVQLAVEVNFRLY
jgi:protein TonB